MLPEREPHPAVYRGLVVLLDSLIDPECESEAWGAAYVGWEIGLLRELGFGLDLSSCAATGATEDLVWVSPRTGRAVSRSAGAPYAERMLVLPGFLVGAEPATMAAILTGLRLTGHFLGRHGLHGKDLSLPAARDRLLAILGRDAPISGG